MNSQRLPGEWLCAPGAKASELNEVAALIDGLQKNRRIEGRRELIAHAWRRAGLLLFLLGCSDVKRCIQA